MKRMLSMLLTLALLCFLCACAQTLPEEVAQTWSADAAQFDDEEGTLVVGADYSGFGVQGVCVRDEGIFYISGSVASYYDFESEEAYCLCSDPQMETTYSSSDDEYRRACQYLLNTDTMELTELYSGQYPACGDVICISGGRAIQSIKFMSV